MSNLCEHNPITFYQAGHCHHPEAMVNTQAPWKSCQFPAMVALIKHQKLGNTLFDTGYSQLFFNATERLPERLYRMTTPVTIPEDQTMVFQLADQGIHAEQIDHIFISHFHADHIAGLKDFPNARFICSQVAFADICEKRGLKAVVKGYLKDLLPEDFASRALFIEDLPLSENCPELAHFDCSHAVSANGDLMAVPLPGHAAGHFGLYIKHETGASFLIGDACWTHHAYTADCRPNKLTGLLMDDTQQYHQTVSQLRALHQSAARVDIIPSHCQETLAGRFCHEH